jgi:hypothetical protein
MSDSEDDSGDYSDEDDIEDDIEDEIEDEIEDDTDGDCEGDGDAGDSEADDIVVVAAAPKKRKAPSRPATKKAARKAAPKTLPLHLSRRGWVQRGVADLDASVPTWRSELTVQMRGNFYGGGDGTTETLAYVTETGAEADAAEALDVLVPRQWRVDATTLDAFFCAEPVAAGDTASHLGDFATRLCATSPPQTAAAEAAVNALDDPVRRAGVLCLPCGFGKTVLALWLYLHYARRHGSRFRAVVLVHKEPLADQWEERARTMIPGVRIGRVQKKKCVFEDCDIVIVMIQSLVASKRSYPAALFAETSMLIVDECHRVGAAAFSRAAPMFGAKYRLGLSATPERRDGLTPVLFWHLGDIIFRTERVFERVFVERLVHDEKNGATLKEIKYGGKAGGKKETLGVARMITNLSKDSKRNYAIVLRMMWACRQGRKVLALTDRRDHAEHLKKYVDEYV